MTFHGIFVSDSTVYRMCLEHSKKLESNGLQLISPPEGLNKDDEKKLCEAISDSKCTAVVAGLENYSTEVFEYNKSLKIIARIGSGTDCISLDSATKNGVLITHIPGVNAQAVAEHALALLLAISRNIVTHDQNIKSGQWYRQPCREIRGKQLGIVGLGKSGLAFAKMGQACGMQVVATDSKKNSQGAHEDIPLLDLDSLIMSSDVVSLHCPLNDETKHLINTKKLSMFKKDAILLNLARGPIIEENALVKALKENRILAAGIDTFDQEPPENSKLLGLENVVLTPHLAGVDFAALKSMIDFALESIIHSKSNDFDKMTIKNPQLCETWRWQ